MTGAGQRRAEAPNGASAGALYAAAVRRLITGEDATESLLASIDVDPTLAEGHAALAFVHAMYGRPTEAVLAARRASVLSRQLPLRRRHHVEILLAKAAGDGDQATVLAREHLAEFPDDILIQVLVLSEQPPQQETTQ